MAPILEVFSALLILMGAAFFLAGTVGLLRFPDVYCRLHALTKADNLGLGLVALGLILRPGEVATRVQILLIWFLALAAAATVCHILARSSLREGVTAFGVDALPPNALPADAVPPDARPADTMPVAAGTDPLPEGAADRDGIVVSSGRSGDRGTP